VKKYENVSTVAEVIVKIKMIFLRHRVERSQTSLHCAVRAKLSRAVYCNRSCLWVLFVCLWVCYHDNSKLRASSNWIFVGKGSDHLQLIKFWSSFALGKGVCGGTKNFGSALLQPARTVYVSLGDFFISLHF